MRLAAMLLAALLLGACTAEQVHRSALSACRASPNTCTDPGAIPESRTPGL
ncbi:hypothetical protein [Roseomonas sp. AR75]|uniref:hypothetical protein n=1 Tax=Roseomonas sp. AR75 TaxID=2562311 RepID=UPI00148590B6|nr:hypothetical protein [Roseomonas sp. AR75]